ncbi:MAG TPA: MG2 domain-containing protein [Pyrinomonadaceae bacterium]|nr:MG2 domain-containing protein [Pyrinomonadaceae bacterium]
MFRLAKKPTPRLVLLLRLPAFLNPSFVYIAIITAAFFVAHSRMQPAIAETEGTQFTVNTDVTTASARPFFSLSTNRTFGTSENPRLWLDHRGIDSLDFRVYRLNDPRQFFTQLSDPHQIGEEEREQVAPNLSARRSLLERIRAVKVWAYAGIKDYFREHLKQDTRRTFNQTFRATPNRIPLNVADYPRLPLLNSNQLVSTWREQLPFLEKQYDQRSIPIGKRESGVYLVEAIGGELRAYTIVVVTDLALVEKLSASGDLLVYAVDRKSGMPRADTRVEIVRERNTIASGRTNSEGIFRTKIPSKTDEVEPDDDEANDSNFIILGFDRENFAISDLDSFYFSNFGEDVENVQGYVYTDRPVYRPSHKVFFKGILRSFDEHRQYHPLKHDTVNVIVKDTNDARVFEQELQLSKRGTFNGEFTLAEEAPLGTYRIEAQTDEGSSTATFDVAEYKKPEFKVSVSTPQRFTPAGSKTKFTIDARYFFGAPVAGAEVKYYVYRYRYYPYFNDSEEPAEDSDEEAEYSQYDNYYSDLTVEGDGKLDSSGRLQVEFDVPSSNENDVWDFLYRIEVQVTDSSRRSINGTASLVATRGSVIARARPDRFVYTKDQTATIAVSTTDYEGKPAPAKITLKFLSRNWVKVEHKENEYDPDYEAREDELGSAEVITDREGHADYNLPITNSGNIVIKTVVHEADKQFVTLGGFIWVAGAGDEWLSSEYYSENRGSIKLVPDKRSYRPGETAHVLAILPQEHADLLVTTELESVMYARHLNVAGKTTIIDVPIEKYYAPNVFLNVTLVRDGDMYSSDQRLVVPARDKILNLEIISDKQEYKPRETASYTILARDAEGAPVPDAEVSLGVVDEAIYSISPDFSGNIRQQFYGTLYNEVETNLSVSYSFRGFAGEKPLNLASNKPSYQLADFKNESEPVQPTIRKNFQDTAFWEANALTGKDGRATVQFRLPDNLTTWRATARGVTYDTKVGVTRSKVIARKDVIIRLETPRFLTQGDTVTLSGIVHNYLKQEKSTQISISVLGARLEGPAQQTITIPKNGEHRVDWQVSAFATGEVRLLAKALTNTESDAVELALDVVPNGLRESKSTRWTTSDENSQQEFTFNLPPNADFGARQLHIEATPSIAGTLFGALDYLTTYPYGCTEQTMSSFLPNIIVSQTLKEFKTASIRNREDLKNKVERGRNRLYSFQHEDGGWGWWKDDPSDPFMTAYVIDGLTLAKQAGYEVDAERLARGREKLQSLLEADSFHDPDTRAFMVHALVESGGADPKYVEKLFAERSHLQPSGRALLALTLSLLKMDQRAAAVALEIERTANIENMTAHWESKRTLMLDSVESEKTEGTALSLKALSCIKPESPLLPFAARWLASDRQQGAYWNSTKDTAFAIFGLIDYVKLNSEMNPSYELEVYLNGETVIAEHVSENSAAQIFQFNKKGGAITATNQVRVVKRGRGMLYFSSSLDYYTNDENVAAQGSTDLHLTREYQRLKVGPVGYDLKWTTTPLTGEIQSGDLIVVKLHVTGKAARHLMLEDPIPSGAEQMQAVGNLNLDYGDKNWTDWYSAREFRDRRTVFFLDHFDGDATFQYAMRVQIPGNFVVAPACVELMYRPEIYANTNSQRFAFVDRH